MSAPVVYFSVRQYLESCSSLQAKIDALNNIITNMMIAMASMASGGSFEPYKFDDGQTRIEVLYQNPDSMAKALIALQNLQDMLRARQFNNANGRMSRLVPGENFIGWGNGNGFNWGGGF